MNHRQLTFRAIDKLNLQPGKVLDVGCGRQTETKQYFEEKGFEWSGCDTIPQKDENIKVCNMEDLNVYKDESFDVVFVCHSFEHCMSPFSSLYEFKRILKDGGKLLLSTPLYCTEQVLYRDDDHYFVLTGEQLAKLLHTCRYKNINGWEELQPNKDIPNSSQIMYAEK